MRDEIPFNSFHGIFVRIPANVILNIVRHPSPNPGLRFEYEWNQTPIGQTQGRREAGDPAPDDDHVEVAMVSMWHEGRL